MFFRSLQFAVVNSSYWNINLKPKQVKCLEAVYSGRDIIAVLPTGYGKSIIFHLLPALFFDKINCGRTPASLPIHPVVYFYMLFFSKYRKVDKKCHSVQDFLIC